LLGLPRQPDYSSIFVIPYAVKAAEGQPHSVDYLMSTEALVFSHSMRIVQVFPF
jgi:hypothetical protein